MDNYEAFFELDSINLINRSIYPIAKIAYYSYNDKFIILDYKIVSFKIIENDDVYYKNVDLSEDEFNEIKKVEN